MSKCVAREPTNLAAEARTAADVLFDGPSVLPETSRWAITVRVSLAITAGIGREWLWHFDNLVTGYIGIARSR